MNKPAGRPVGEHDAKRREIANATWSVIADRGFEKASMRAIAREAGYTTGVLVHYFENKEDLLKYAFEQVAAELQEELKEATRGGSVLESIRHIAMQTLPLTAERARLVSAWQSFILAADKSPIIMSTVTSVVGRNHKLLASLVEKGQEVGVIRDDFPAKDLADQIDAMVDGLSRLAPLQPDRLTAERLVNLLDVQLKMIER